MALRTDWRRIGNSAIDLALPASATGPVDRVWYSADGVTLFAAARNGRVFGTADGETWTAVTEAAPAPDATPAAGLPEPSARLRGSRRNPSRMFAVGRFAYRSDDGGRSWSNLTAYRGRSILGDIHDLAVSPRDPDEIAVAGAHGVWRSMDGGQSWAGLNESLPNLPVRRIQRLPGGSRAFRILIDGVGEADWSPGEKQAWRPAESPDSDRLLREALSTGFGTAITAVAAGAEMVYAGSADGRIWYSPDRGQTWTATAQTFPGAVEGFAVDSREPRTAIAALAGKPGVQRPARVLRTTNGGIFWDDITGNLPDSPVHGVAADRPTGAVYAATDRGVYLAVTDLAAAGTTLVSWSRLEGLPAAPAVDVRLDAAGNQIYAALDGYGIYAGTAPHRLLDLKVVCAADLSVRAAAPGSLLSVLGGRVRQARAGDLNVPVLAASDAESQIQVPFEARGSSLSLALSAAHGDVTLGLPLQDVSPAVFVDRDGTPMILDADNGVLLDAMSPARSGMRLQILATGLGSVRPAWPTGMAAPLENPPQVVAPLRVLLDQAPVEVTRASLAPGYVGFYLVEIRMPDLLNAGPAELLLEAGGLQSNRVRVYLAP